LRQPFGEGGQQALLHALRQGGREQHGAATGPRVEAQQHRQHALHVDIAGMHFIDHQHLAHQAQQPQRLVLAVQHRQQHLVDGAHASRRQQRTFVVVGQPGRTAGRRGVVELPRIVLFGTGRQHGGGKFADELAIAVGQHQAGGVGKQACVRLGDAAIHGIGGGHGRQRDEKPVGNAAGQQAVRQHQGRLGLAGAGDVFEQVDLRSVVQRRLGGPALQW